MPHFFRIKTIFLSTKIKEIDVERQQTLCYKKSEIESLLSGFNETINATLPLGNPVEIRGGPAAVSGNENRMMSLCCIPKNRNSMGRRGE